MTLTTTAAKPGEPPSPLGSLAAAAEAKGNIPHHGYVYSVLKRQGPSAPGGAHDYVAGGKMIGGFGLIAYPADYGRSGVMSFMVAHDGVVTLPNSMSRQFGPSRRATISS